VNLSKNNNIGNNENSGRQLLARSYTIVFVPHDHGGNYRLFIFHHVVVQSFLQRANASETVHDSGTSDSEMHEENEGRAHTRRRFVTRFAVRPSGRNDYM